MTIEAFDAHALVAECPRGVLIPGYPCGVLIPECPRGVLSPELRLRDESEQQRPQCVAHLAHSQFGLSLSV